MSNLCDGMPLSGCHSNVDDWEKPPVLVLGGRGEGRAVQNMKCVLKPGELSPPARVTNIDTMYPV